MRKITYVIGLLVAISLIAQDKTAIKFAKTIEAGDLKDHLSIIASDEYEGRETGKKGQKMAADYIAKHFETLGFEAPVNGTYFQQFDLTSSSLGSIYFRRGDEKKVGFQDFVYYSKSETMGEEYVQVVMASENMENYKGSYVVLVTDKLMGVQKQLDEAKESGAAGFVVVLKNENEFGSVLNRLGGYLKAPSLGLDGRDNEADKMIITNVAMADWIFEQPIDEVAPGTSAKLVFNADYLDSRITTENVLGFLKGSEKPEEILVITSHYDHVGIINGEIHNGADDDGSGTVTVLEVAEAFAAAAKKGKRPKRSILFMTVTGEEKGLLGSQYYTDIDPVFPLKNTIANLNIDMVGRVDDAHSEDTDYIYVIGSDKLSTELHTLSEDVNDSYVNLDLDYTYNDVNDPNRFYYRSDHYNFAKNSIPVIFYFNGTHADYHKPTDTVEKINFEIMEKRAKLVFHTAWELANREERIKVDKKEGGTTGG